jgi:radical SAM superfamily enzyme YgiQ (UPF0313 family)
LKILLVQPKEKIWIRSRTVSLGLAYIAAVLEKAGHSVSIIDQRVSPLDLTIKVDLVGVTATTPTINQAWEILKIFKETQGAVTVIGGPHVSALPEESAALAYVDYVVKGEGEQSMLELCEALQNKTSTSKISGLVYKNEGQILSTPPRTPLADIDSLPFPAYHLFPDLKKHYTNPQPLISNLTPAANIITSRGCPYDCVFCFKGVYGTKYRFRSKESVIAEWRWLIEKHGVKEIAIQDDLFNIKADRAKDICRELIKEKLVLPWTTPNGIRADAFDEELAGLMKSSGCYRIAFGIESGNQKILDSIGKKIKLEKIAEAIKIAKKAGLKTLGFFVMGSPGENSQTMQDSIDFAIKTDPDYAQFSVATPFPGTRLFEVIKKEGSINTSDWSSYSQFDRKEYFSFGYIERAEVEKYVTKAFRRFYLRPFKLLKLGLNTLRPGNIKHTLSGAFHFIFSSKNQ